MGEIAVYGRTAILLQFRWGDATEDALATDRAFPVDALPEVADHGRGVGCQRAVEPGRVALLVAELGQQPDRAAQGCSLGKYVGHGHRPTIRPSSPHGCTR